MGSQDGLVEIHPRELRFTFEVKKQSSCSVYLVNKSDEYVAFKVKTTSPKRYSVRPNIGVILPRETCFFTVAMQALKTAPPDLQIKDKFLVQTTVVPFGTADGGIVPAFFSKETGGYIEENKLRVVLVSSTQAEEEQLIGGVPNANTAVKVPVAKEKLNVVPNGVNEIPCSLKTSSHPLRENPAPFSVNESHIPAPSKEAPVTSAESVIESHTPAPSKEAPVTSAESVNEHIPAPSKEAPVTSAKSAHHFKGTPSFSVESQFSSTEANVALNECPESLKDTSAPKKVTILSRLVNAENLNYVTEDVQNLKSKLNNLEVKLEEAESLITKLREETRVTIHERDRLQHEMVFAKRKGTSRSQAGFPLLFVVYVAFLGVSLGYMLHL